MRNKAFMESIGRILIVSVSIVLTTVQAFAGEWTLQAAIEHALSHSPDALMARHKVQAAEAGVQQANAAFFPQLIAQSAYTRTNNPANVFMSVLNQRAFSPTLDFNDVPDADNINVNGTAQLMLFNGGRDSANLKAAKSMEASAQEDAGSVSAALSLEVARTFFTIWKAREYVKAADASVRSYDNNLTIANRRFAQDSILRADVLDVEVQMSQARESLIRARNAQSISLEVLRTLISTDDPDPRIPEDMPLILPPLVGMAVDRAELKSIKKMQEAARSKLDAARGGYLPSVAAFSSVDYNRGWELNGDSTSYTAGVKAQWDLFDGFLTRGRVREAQAVLNNAMEMERKLRLGIELENQQARLNFEEAEQRVTVTEKAVAQASESVELTRSRFDQGLVIATQLIDAETALLGAKVRNAEARADRLIAIAAWRKASGLPVF